MENNELNLSKIWQKQTSISPDFTDLKNRIAGYKKENGKKRWVSNITLTLTIAVILAIWFLYEAKTIYPKIGMSMIILAISLSLIKFNQFYNNFKNLDKSMDNKAYLNTLLEIQQKQKSIQANFMNIYFILLTIGLLFYMYEFSLRMSGNMAIIAYGLTLGWIAFVWFYLKPKMAKKQNLKIEIFIQSIKKIIKE